MGSHRIRLRDDRGIVTGWFVKVAIGLAVLGIIVFDSGAIVVNRLSAQASAEDVANAITSEISFGHLSVNQQTVLRLAEEQTAEFGVRLVEATYNPTTKEIYVKVRKRATTIVAGKIGAFKDWLRATGEATVKAQ